MQISQSLEELQHVTFDLRFGEMNGRVVEKTRQIVIHVRGCHVHNRALALVACHNSGQELLLANWVVEHERLTGSLRVLYSHVHQLQDIFVGEQFQKFDFSQCRDGELSNIGK